MDRLNTRASAMERRVPEAPETPAEANKKTRPYNNTRRSSYKNIRRSSSSTGTEYDGAQEEGTTGVSTTAPNVTNASSTNVPKIKVNASKTSSIISKVITESEESGTNISKASARKQLSNPTKTLKRKGTGDEPGEEKGSRVVAKKAKVTKTLVEALYEELGSSDGEGQKTNGKVKAKITLEGSENGKASKGEISTKEFVEVDKGHKTPNSRKTEKNAITAAKLAASSTSQDVGGIPERGVAKSTLGNNPLGTPCKTSSLDGGAGSRAPRAQIPEFDSLRNSFIVTDPNKPRPRGLGRAHFKETPAYTKLMEVATQVKRVARIMTNKLTAVKAAKGKNFSIDTIQSTITEACEKLEKFIQIYSPQVKFLSVEEHTALIKAAVQCLGDIETAELPDDDFQKILCTFLDGMELGENQATAVGLYPILELYKVEEEAGELTPDVKKLVASINACLVRKSKEAEARLVSPDYVPEDYLTRMQKRVLSMGNVSKPVYDDWDKFLMASALPKAAQRAQRPNYADQVSPSLQPPFPVLKTTPKSGDWVKNHMISKIISKHRTNKRLETKMNNIRKVVREHKSYDVNPEPMVYSSYRRPLGVNETKEASEMPEYDAFGRPLGLDKVEEAGDSMEYGSSGSTLEF